MYDYIKSFGKLTQCESWSLSNYEGNGMHSKNKTQFADQVKNLNFSCFKEFKSHEHLFEIFSLQFHLDAYKTRADLQMELTDLE